MLQRMIARYAVSLSAYSLCQMLRIGADRAERRWVATHSGRMALLLLAAVASLAAGVAGCGSAQPLSKAQLVRRANALCTQVQQKMKKVGSANTTQELAHVARKLAGFEQQQIESMRKLTPPAALASDWKQMIEAADEVAANAGTLSTDVSLKKDKQAGEALKQIGRIHERILPIVKRDGFISCEELA